MLFLKKFELIEPNKESNSIRNLKIQKRSQMTGWISEIKSCLLTVIHTSYDLE